MEVEIWDEARTVRLLVCVVCAVMLVSVVSAVQPTYQFNKIYLQPFYRVSLSSGTNVTYTVAVVPPDGISKVVNAMLSFNIQVNGQTQTLTAWVNGKSCNNPTYSIATAFSTTGQLQAYFDCSNIINASGTYNVTLLSAVNTGAVSGWLDLTYMNRPLGAVEVKGTEYVQGDPGTLFLLLKDSSGIPIENATCTVDIYYPNTNNQIHPEWIDNGLMLYKEEGLYYYDFTVPPVIGLYIVSANCRYFETNKQYYVLDDPAGPTRNITLGTFTGDTFVLNDFAEWLYTQCDSGAGGGGTKVCDSYNEWTVHNETYNSLSVVYLGESNGAPTLTLSWWNWTSNAWIALPNTLTFKSTAATGVPSGIDEYLSNAVPVEAINNVTKKVRIRSYAVAGSTFKMFNNWLALKATQSASQIQDLKGSGEIHVSGADPLENRYVDISTCEGFADGRCAFLTNDEEFDLAEGELEDLVNISVYATDPNLEFRYYSPFSVDCTALYWIKQWNGTAWVDFTDYEVYSQPAYENCEIKLEINALSGSSYQYWLKFDNYMKWEVDWSKQISDTVNETIAKMCDERNFTYTVPITETSVMPNDTVTKFCYQAKDDQYWINSYYTDSQFVDVAGPYASYVQEMRFYRPGLQMRYEWLKMESVPGIGWVGGTEYTQDETVGRVVVRVLDNSGSPVNGANCTLNIYPPNGTEIFYSAEMDFRVNQTQGGYYEDFNLTKQVGVYAYYVDCTKLGQKYYMLGAFHISPESSLVLNVNQTMTTVASDVNQTKSWVSQIWTWVQSLFNWTQQNENQVVMKTLGG